MKKLFISCPMKGRTNENIEISIEKMHKMAEIIFDQPLEVIDSFLKVIFPKQIIRLFIILEEVFRKLPMQIILLECIIIIILKDAVLKQWLQMSTIYRHF